MQGLISAANAVKILCKNFLIASDGFSENYQIVLKCFWASNRCEKKDFCFPFEEKLLPAAFTGNPLALAEISDTFICKPDKEQIEQIILALREKLQNLPSQIQKQTRSKPKIQLLRSLRLKKKIQTVNESMFFKS